MMTFLWTDSGWKYANVTEKWLSIKILRSTLRWRAFKPGYVVGSVSWGIAYKDTRSLVAEFSFPFEEPNPRIISFILN